MPAPAARWLLASGLVALLGQVVLLRELSVAFFGSELILALAIGLWLLGGAAGAACGRWPAALRDSQVCALLLAAAIALPASAGLARGLRVLFHALPGAWLPLPAQLLALAAALLPASALCGLLFQWSARLHVEGGGTLAGAYAIEGAGGLAGGAAATAALHAGAQGLDLAIGCGLCAAAAGGLVGPRRAGWTAVPAAAVACALVAAAAARGPLDAWLTRLDHPALAASRDTPYGRITVDERDGLVSVFQNGALAWESQGTAAEELVGAAALEVPSLRRVLLLGGGGEGLVGEVLRHHPAQVDLVEVDEAALRLVAARAGPAVEEPLRAPGVRVTFDDPRRFLQGPGRWDLILVAMPEPDSAQSNRFYTREFFAACAAHLEPQGVLALRLRGAENLWPRPLVRRTASIDRALRAAFADVLALPGATTLLLASQAPLARDPEVLAARWRERGLRGRLVSPAWLRDRLGNDRVAEVAGLLAAAAAEPNRDVRPVCYPHTLVLWLALFFPELALRDPPAPGPAWAAAGALALALLLLAGRRRLGPGAGRALLVALAGFAGMVLELLLVLHYQSQSGALYQDLGLLLTAFMAGLALGSLAVARAPAAQAASRGLAALLLGALAALGLLSAALFASGRGGGLWGCGLLLLAAGADTGALFAWASRAGAGGQRERIAPLYAADLIGGCLGSLAGSLLLIPLAGLAATALLLAALAAAGLGACLALGAPAGPRRAR